MMANIQLPKEWHHPLAEFSFAPFWFWNDDLQEAELSRQLDEFQSHGVDAFVLHPRLGLPEYLGWMSQPLLDKMRFAIEQAKSRGMWVILYDEGMYPSGSSSGQVVAENPSYQCRGMVRINLDTVQANSIEQGVAIDEHRQIVLGKNQTLVAEVDYQGHHYAIVDRPIDSVIRGLHYMDERVISASGESIENSPLATDLLNPEAVACFIRLVYDRFYSEFGTYFGTTITAIFTDEPALLGRPREKDIMPSTVGIMEHINRFLGYDFTPYLPALWDKDAPKHIFADFERAIEHRFEETYYTQLYDWCEAHNIQLTGHPAEPNATRHLRYFHIPGQDIVWRRIEPNTPSALEEPESTQAKAASSMMLHTNRRRNANEFCGAYGHSLTFDDMQWLANWLLVRGCNLLIPHAFYYTLRGPRKNERPPDVGLHSEWWDTDFTDFAYACRRLCWLNTDSEHICHVAILGEHHNLPWRAAKHCFQNQIDFNYLDVEDLQHCKFANHRMNMANQSYQVLIVDGAISTAVQGQVDSITEEISILYWSDDPSASINQLKDLLAPSPSFAEGASGLRIRQVRKMGYNWYILFNEEETPINISVDLGNVFVVNPYTNQATPYENGLYLDSYELCVLVCESD